MKSSITVDHDLMVDKSETLFAARPVTADASEIDTRDQRRDVIRDLATWMVALRHPASPERRR